MIAFIVSLYADGLSPIALEKVVPGADVIVLAEIVSNDVTIEERKPENGRASIIYRCNIGIKVLENIKGRAPKEMKFKFEFTVIKGVWLVWSGSGLEVHMKAKEKYLLLLEMQDSKLKLLRAEKPKQLSLIQKLLKLTIKKGPTGKAEN